MAKQAKRRAKHPRFVREKDLLVRVGWRVDRGKEYRLGTTPHYAIETVISRILDVKDNSGNFTAAEITDLADVEYGEIPEPQARLALRWLVESGLIEKFTNGYSVKQGVELLDNSERSWNRLPRR